MDIVIIAVGAVILVFAFFSGYQAGKNAAQTGMVRRIKEDVIATRKCVNEMWDDLDNLYGKVVGGAERDSE